VLNRTLLDIICCFLVDGNLPGNLWAEAVHVACYIINLRPSKTSSTKTLEELFSKIKPDISKLRIFVSLVYVYDTRPNKRKLAPRFRPCLHLSLDDKTKGYRCYDPSQCKVIVSIDVCFLKTSPPIILLTINNNSPSLITRPSISISNGPSYNTTSFVVSSNASAEELDTLISVTTNASSSPIITDQPTPPSFVVLLPASPTVPAPRRFTRIRKAPKAHADYIPIDFIETFIGASKKGSESLNND
jgi:hypothetical protein